MCISTGWKIRDYRPLVGSQKIKHVLEERYREKYLSEYCASESCQTSHKAEWREMVGASLERSIYMFVVDTTVQQDLALIEQFNAEANQNHFNGMTRNCADFTRRIINTYFPNATGPDYINDFGMTSPKAIARSFTRYAHRHPDAGFRVLHFAQVPGTIKRSSECRAGTEQLVRSKKLLVPMLIFADHVVPFVAASYILTGRFDPQRELEEYPTIEATEAEHQIKLAKAENNDVLVEELESDKNEQRAKMVGTSEEWKQYRASFAYILAESAGEQNPSVSLNQPLTGSLNGPLNTNGLFEEVLSPPGRGGNSCGGSRWRALDGIRRRRRIFPDRTERQQCLQFGHRCRSGVRTGARPRRACPEKPQA